MKNRAVSITNIQATLKQTGPLSAYRILNIYFLFSLLNALPCENSMPIYDTTRFQTAYASFSNSPLSGALQQSDVRSAIDSLLEQLRRDGQFDRDMLSNWMPFIPAQREDSFRAASKIGAHIVQMASIAKDCEYDEVGDYTVDAKSFLTTMSFQKLTVAQQQLFERMFSYPLTTISAKTNTAIAQMIKQAKKYQIPSPNVLYLYSQIKQNRDKLEEAFNPWIYTKRIDGGVEERGYSAEEVFFEKNLWKCKNELPTDIIRSLFYPPSRNVTAIECGFLYDSFARSVAIGDKVLIVNPSPDYLLQYMRDDTLSKGIDTWFAVTDKTVADLYNLQFHSDYFIPFSDINKLSGITKLLIFSRDSTGDNLITVFSSIGVCASGAQIMATVPQSFFGGGNTEWIENVHLHKCRIKNILLLPASVCTQVNRKKAWVVMEKGVADRSDYTLLSEAIAHEDRLWLSPTYFPVKQEDILNAGITPREMLQSEIKKAKRKPAGASRNSAKAVFFSPEIAVRFVPRNTRKKGFAAKAYYCAILRGGERRKFGKRLTPEIEKGLTGKTEQELLHKIKCVVYDDQILSIIAKDVTDAYSNRLHELSLKTLWLCAHSDLKRDQKYNFDHMRVLLDGENQALGNLHPATATQYDYTEAASDDFQELKYWTQLKLLLDWCIRKRILASNPVDEQVRELSNRATSEQREVRNALTKKTFSKVEEQKLLAYLYADVRKKDYRQKRYLADAIALGAGILFFTGMELREVSELSWRDFRKLNDIGIYQLIITGNGSDSAQKEWKMYRVLPIHPQLVEMLIQKKQAMLSLGLSESDLLEQPILTDYQINSTGQLENLKPVSYQKLAGGCRKIIDQMGIKEQIVLLPDDKGGMLTNLSYYRGNIFKSNFRYRANHACGFTQGEISYYLGVAPPDTFSGHYCDFLNDYVQLGMVGKLTRWYNAAPIKQSSQVEDKDTIVIDKIPGRIGGVKISIAGEVNSQDRKMFTFPVDCRFGYRVECEED